MKTRGKRHLYKPVFFLGILATVIFIPVTMHFVAAKMKESAMNTAEIYSARVESLLNSLFHKTDVLEAMVLNNRGEMSQSVYEDLAKSLSDGDGIKAIQYLPDGVVEYCYPMEGNEKVMGNSVFDNPLRRDDALLALNTKSIALSGPYDLTQGGFGLVARNPVFMSDDNGQDQFLGFSVIILSLPEALKSVMLEELTKDGYAYQLYCDGEDGKVLILKKSKHALVGKPAEYEIKVPNHVWHLSITPEGGWIHWKLLCIELLTGIILSFLLAVIVQQRKDQEKVLRAYAYMDPLTELYNRRWLESGEMNHMFGGSTAFVLFYFDVDHFKAFNDRYGHIAGDELLKEFARRLEAVFKSKEGLLRIGGDEFIAVVKIDKGDEQITEIKDTLQRTLNEPFVLNDIKTKFSVSYGYARFPEDGESGDDLIRAADSRMYRNKRMDK